MFKDLNLVLYLFLQLLLPLMYHFHMYVSIMIPLSDVTFVFQINTFVLLNIIVALLRRATYSIVIATLCNGYLKFASFYSVNVYKNIISAKFNKCYSILHSRFFRTYINQKLIQLPFLVPNMISFRQFSVTFRIILL